jgi:hypothetical protein
MTRRGEFCDPFDAAKGPKRLSRRGSHNTQYIGAIERSGWLAGTVHRELHAVRIGLPRGNGTLIWPHF